MLWNDEIFAASFLPLEPAIEMNKLKTNMHKYYHK